MLKIDYSKHEYTKEEISIMLNETEYLKEKNPNHVPIFIEIDSNILNIDKKKFLVPDDINFDDFINNILKKKLVNLYSNDKLLVSVVKLFDSVTEIKLQTTKMNEIYYKYRDTETNLLILRIKRYTTFKTVKSYIKYFAGY